MLGLCIIIGRGRIEWIIYKYIEIDMWIIDEIIIVYKKNEWDMWECVWDIEIWILDRNRDGEIEYNRWYDVREWRGGRRGGDDRDRE